MKRLLVFLIVPMLFALAGFTERNYEEGEIPSATETTEQKADFIRWMDFNAKREVINCAIKKHKQFLTEGETEYGTCEILASVALKNSNKFSVKRDNAIIRKLTPLDIEKVQNNKYFVYYANCFHAVLDGIIDKNTGDTTGFSPIGRNSWYNHYDDFGNSRGYGYKRKHLGNDLFGSTGAPIIAVEGGTITELGWNQYGGWRVGIRSDDTKRYYYYAHLRKNKPFAEGLKLGDRVAAGDLIGYLGVTGYSRKENTNMKTTNPHLHFGMQIIFDKSQEDGIGELWIDVYEIVKFLSSHRAEVVDKSK